MGKDVQNVIRTPQRNNVLKIPIKHERTLEKDKNKRKNPSNELTFRLPQIFDRFCYETYPRNDKSEIVSECLGLQGIFLNPVPQTGQ